MTVEIAQEYVKVNGVLDSDDHLQARELWDNRFRVNVWKYDPNRIVQSYFVKVSDSGVVDCSPKLGA